MLLRRRPEMALFGMIAITMTVLGAPASSMPRHSMIAIPAFAALALKLGPRFSTVVAVGFAALQVLFVAFAFGGVRPP
jgi:hypothetical protein